MSGTSPGQAAGQEFVWAADDAGFFKGEPSLLVVRRSTFDGLSRMTRALKCSTWGELREQVDPDVYKELCELAGYGSFEGYTKHLSITGVAPLPNAESVAAESYDPDATVPPPDDEPFDAYRDIPACADGDWPPAVEYLMNQELPASIIDEYGRRYMTTFNGEFAQLDPAHRDEVLRDLKSLGFILTEEPGLLTLFD